jgi:integrase
MRGFGRIFKRGDVWWLAYCHRGKEVRESSHSTKEADAKRLLKKRLGEIGRGRLVGPIEERVTFGEMADDLVNDYRTNRKRSIESAELSVRHLRGFFGLDRALDITTDRVRAYIALRQQRDGERKGAANASINRELAALKRMFSLAIEAEKLSSKPKISLLEENNARQGFLDHAGFLALWENLPSYLKDPVTFLYLSGWRISEMRALEWRDVDLAGKVVRLRPEISKNKDGRLLPLSGELLDLFDHAREQRRLDCQFVFHTDGKPIGDFRKAWKTACKAAGIAGTIVHDLRRTAVRNMVRAGIPERVAMRLSGHLTRDVFDRYTIASEADLAEAVGRLHAHLTQQPKKSAVTAIGNTRRSALILIQAEELGQNSDNFSGSVGSVLAKCLI